MFAHMFFQPPEGFLHVRLPVIHSVHVCAKHMDSALRHLSAAPPHIPVPYAVSLQAAVIHLKPAAALDQLFHPVPFPQAEITLHVGDHGYISGHGHFPDRLVQAVVGHLGIKLHQHIPGVLQGQGLSLL